MTCWMIQYVGRYNMLCFMTYTTCNEMFWYEAQPWDMFCCVTNEMEKNGGVLYSLINVKMLGSHAHMYVTCIGYFSLWWVRTLTYWKWKWLSCLTWCYNGHYFFLVFSNNTRDASPTSTRTKGCANHLEGPYSHIWVMCRVVNTPSMTRIRKLSKRIQF